MTAQLSQRSSADPDVAVGQGDEENTPKIARQTEADLPGHLTGEAAKKSNQNVIRAAPGKKYDDFQLSYALDMLRGKMTVSSVVKSAEAN